MRKVFISYARSDYDKALELYNYLSEHGMMPWMDKKDLLPGQEWKTEIKKAIRESVVFIACLSNNSVSKQGFVQVELKEALDVAQELPEGVIYIIPVRLDSCEVPSRLSMYQWVDFFENGEKERLTKAIQLRINPTQPLQVEKEKYFDAGERVKAVRNELGINTSQFVEVLDLPSQREYEAMENNEKEFPSSLLKKVSEVSGVRLEWLKHGKGSRYETDVVILTSIEDGLKQCVSLNPQEYYFTLDKKQLHAGIVVQVSEYRFQVLETGISLDFWNWIDSHWAIARFYHFLDELTNSWHDIRSVFLPTNIDRQLYDGEIHFLSALRNNNGLAVGFLYDLLDLGQHRLNPQSPSKVYGISSLRKIQDYFKWYLNREQERK